MTHVFPSGTKEVFRVRLASGREVQATANHPFLSYDGWRPLGDLTAGSRVAVPRHTPGPLETRPMAEPEMTDVRAAKLARLDLVIGTHDVELRTLLEMPFHCRLHVRCRMSVRRLTDSTWPIFSPSYCTCVFPRWISATVGNVTVTSGPSEKNYLKAIQPTMRIAPLE